MNLRFWVYVIITEITSGLWNQLGEISNGNIQTKDIIIAVLRVVSFVLFSYLGVKIINAPKLDQEFQRKLFTIILLLFVVSFYIYLDYIDVQSILERPQDLTYQIHWIVIGMNAIWRYIIICVIFPLNRLIKVFYLLPSFGCLVGYIFYLKATYPAVKLILFSVGIFIATEYIDTLWAYEFIQKNKSEVNVRLAKQCLDILPESVLILDEKGRVKYHNFLFKKKFNLDPKENSYLPTDFFSKFDTLKMRKREEDTLETGKECNILERIGFKNLINLLSEKTLNLENLDEHAIVYDTFYTLDNERIPIEIKLTLFDTNKADTFDNSINYNLIIRDTTERDRIVSLENEKIALRNNFLASFSHELRTPLNSNLILIEESLNSNLIPDQAKSTLLKPALVSGKMLLSIINDVLDYSQFLCQKLQMKVSYKDLVSTIKEVMDICVGKCNSKGLRLTYTGPDALNYTTDHQRVMQILINLLCNSIKFTSTGSININLENLEEGYYKITVEDTGIGMSTETQSKLKQLLAGNFGSKVSVSSSGAGIGLLISNELAKRLSNDYRVGLSFESIEQAGSRFSISLAELALPNQGSSQEATIEEFQEFHDSISPGNRYHRYSEERGIVLLQRFTHTDGSLTNREKERKESKILIVDDDPYNCMALEVALKCLSIPMIRAYNGKEAVDRCLSDKEIKLVFMDANMPIMNGFEATIEIRKLIKENKLGKMRVIGTTAYVAEDEIKKCYDSGMDLVLHKPLSKIVLISALRNNNYLSIDDRINEV